MKKFASGLFLSRRFVTISVAILAVYFAHPGTVLALRIGLHLALLQEARDALGDAHRRCPECHHDVPDTAFDMSRCATLLEESARQSAVRTALESG